MTISALAFTLLNVFVKSLEGFSVYQIVFFRAAGSLFFTIPFLLKSKIPMLGKKRKLLVMRSIYGLISMLFFFLALKHTAMGAAVSIRYIAPIFAAIFALFYLKENIKKVQWVYFGIAFLGVFIIKGADTQFQMGGTTYALISAIFAGLVYVTIRKIGAAEHPVVIVNYFMVISSVACGLIALTDWVHPVGREWLVLMSLGVFGYFAQLYMTKGFQQCETNKIAPFKYLEVIFTTSIGILYFKEDYGVFIILGMAIILIALSLNLKVKTQN